MKLRFQILPLVSVVMLAIVLATPANEVTLTRGPYLQSCSATDIVIRWRTDVPTDSAVRFHAAAQQETEVHQTALVTEHEVRLTGLSSDTTYSYAIGLSSNTLASGTNYYFRTVPTNSRPVRVWAIGDAGTGTEFQRAVRDAYVTFTNSALTDVWLMLGDNAYEFGSDEDFQVNVFDLYSDIFRNTVLWPAIGNHELESGTVPVPYLEMFTLPTNGEAGGVASHTELYYSYDYANVHFVCLDSEVSDKSPGSAMLNWLRADLAATSKDWIIAYWHHPPYSMGTDFSDTTPKLIAMRERVAPILESYGVDLVLCGHSHVYERSFLLNGHYGHSWTFSPTNALDHGLGRADAGGAYHKPAGGAGANRGTVYVVCGNSGQGGVINFQHHPAMAVKFDGYGSVVLDINDLRLDAKYLRPNGAIDDYFTIEKSIPPNLDPVLKITRTNNCLIISWPASPREFLLESSASLPAVSWQSVTNTRVTTDGRNSVNVNIAGNAFYRLRSAP